jgi:hypothetical protein
MKKLFLILVVICVAAFVFGKLRRYVRQTQVVTATQAGELDALTRRMAEDQKTNVGLRNELTAKKNHLRLVARHPEITPELLNLIEGNFANGSPGAWAQLRQELGLGWNESPDYLLVRKQALKNLDYVMFYSGTTPTPTAMDLLGLSSEEKSSLTSALRSLRDGWEGNSLKRTEPHGDIVAQYTLTPPDAAAEQSLSNNFTAALVSAVGQERADLMQREAWSNFRRDLGPTESETLTIRQTTVNGEPDLTWQIQRGPDGSGGGASQPVRYAMYPSSWFLTCFPGGWDTLAQREGLQLPAAFRKQK